MLCNFHSHPHFIEKNVMNGKRVKFRTLSNASGFCGMICIVREPLSVLSGKESVENIACRILNYIHMKNGRCLVFLLPLFFILNAIRYVMKVCITEVRFCLLLIKVNRFEVVWPTVESLLVDECLKGSCGI